MTPTEIRDVVSRLDTSSVRDEEVAWQLLRPLGEAVVPFLLEAYPSFRKWQGRTSLVFHSIRYARTNESAFQLGVAALSDKATIVRYRACALLAYSQRVDALPHLESSLVHPVKRTADDAKAAIDAISERNHHYFEDRGHTGQIRWRVNTADTPPI